MANPSKAKGTKAETDFIRWLIKTGWPQAERRVLHGNADRGDVINLTDLVCSIKMRKRGATMDLSGWLRDLDGMRVNARDPNAEEPPSGLLIVRRTGYPDPARWYAIQEAGQWFDLYGELLT